MSPTIIPASLFSTSFNLLLPLAKQVACQQQNIIIIHKEESKTPLSKDLHSVSHFLQSNQPLTSYHPKQTTTTSYITFVLDLLIRV
jgi:hypothetical protein